MRIAISGASGFIGSFLIPFLREKGHEMTVISRESFMLPPDEFLAKKIEGHDAVINLAGAPILKRWTSTYKDEILKSRTETTRAVADAIGRASSRPAVLISASAVGIYSPVGEHDETSTSLADDFLASVCKAWESEARKAESLTRVAILRQGIVLGEGGSLDRIYLPFSIGLGARIGSGNQYMSWIHIQDLALAILRILEDSGISGIVNAVAQYPVTNREFTMTMGRVVRQPAFLTVPPAVLKLAYGEAADTLISGQNVIPQKLLDAGFQFHYPTIAKALVQIYGSRIG